MTKSYAPQVIADSTGEWCGNALRFATRKEAERQVSDLAFRWTSVRETRVIESDDPVNYQYVDRKLRAFIAEPEPESKPQLICSICELPIEPHPISGWAGGNNAEPVNSGRCCDDCDAQVVIPLRIARIMASQKR